MSISHGVLRTGIRVASDGSTGSAPLFSIMPDGAGFNGKSSLAGTSDARRGISPHLHLSEVSSFHNEVKPIKVKYWYLNHVWSTRAELEEPGFVFSNS